MTQAEIIAAIAALDAALATGARSVSHAGKTITYRDVSEMMRTRAFLAGQLISPRRPPSGLATWRTGDS